MHSAPAKTLYYYGKTLVLPSTSNITEAIDEAFLDRADLKVFVGNPSSSAIYQILQSCIQELMRCGIIRETVISLCSINSQITFRNWRQALLFPGEVSGELMALCNKISADSNFSYSGRQVRKLCFIAHALHIKVLSF